MASGFVERYKGKVDVDQAWIGGAIQGRWGQTNNVAVSTLGVGSSLQLPVYPAIGTVLFNASTGLGVFTLGTPKSGDVVLAGCSTCGSSGWFLKVSTTPTAAGVTIQGTIGTGASGASTIVSVAKSSIACTIELVGLSSIMWQFNGVSPSTLGHLVWSTTT